MNAFRDEVREKDRKMGEMLTCIPYAVGCLKLMQLENGEIVNTHHGGVQIGLECSPRQ